MLKYAASDIPYRKVSGKVLLRYCHLYGHRPDRYFHVTYGNTVSCTVAHNFVLDFFPAADTSFYQNLSDTGKTQTVFQNALKLCQIMCDTTAGTAQCIGRTQYDRIADLIGKSTPS